MSRVTRSSRTVKRTRPEADLAVDWTPHIECLTAAWRSLAINDVDFGSIGQAVKALADSSCCGALDVRSTRLKDTSRASALELSLSLLGRITAPASTLRPSACVLDPIASDAARLLSNLCGNQGGDKQQPQVDVQNFSRVLNALLDAATYYDGRDHVAIFGSGSSTCTSILSSVKGMFDPAPAAGFVIDDSQQMVLLALVMSPNPQVMLAATEVVHMIVQCSRDHVAIGHMTCFKRHISQVVAHRQPLEDLWLDILEILVSKCAPRPVGPRYWNDIRATTRAVADSWLDELPQCLILSLSQPCKTAVSNRLLMCLEKVLSVYKGNDLMVASAGVMKVLVSSLANGNEHAFKILSHLLSYGPPAGQTDLLAGSQIGQALVAAGGLEVLVARLPTDAEAVCLLVTPLLEVDRWFLHLVKLGAIRVLGIHVFCEDDSRDTVESKAEVGHAITDRFKDQEPRSKREDLLRVFLGAAWGDGLDALNVALFLTHSARKDAALENYRWKWRPIPDDVANVARENRGVQAVLCKQLVLLQPGSADLRDTAAALEAVLDTVLAKASKLRKAQAQQPPETAEFHVPESYLNRADVSDVTFMVEGRPFYACKLALVDASPAFGAMLTGGFTEQRAGHINIPNVSYAAWELVMRYAYTRRVEVPHDLAQEVLAVADQYLLSGLVEQCEAGLVADVNPGSLLKMYNTMPNLRKVQQACIRCALGQWAAGGVIVDAEEDAALRRRMAPELLDLLVSLLAKPHQ